MGKQHWQDWGLLLLGTWVSISPWSLPPDLATLSNPPDVVRLALWNQHATGFSVSIVALAALISFAEWEEWVNLGFGAWLFLSPWFIGFGTSNALTWSSVITGGVIVVLTIWTLVDERTSPPEGRTTKARNSERGKQSRSAGSSDGTGGAAFTKSVGADKGRHLGKARSKLS